MDRNRRPCARLLPLLLATAWARAGSVPAATASEDIDTSFDAPSASLTTSSPAVPTPASAVSEPDQDAPDANFAESHPFENLSDPGAASYERHWYLNLATLFARSAPDTSSFHFDGTLDRRFGSESFDFTPRFEWSRTSERPDDTKAWTAGLGSYATWQPFQDHQAGADAAWTFQDGPDDWTLSSDWSWNPTVSDWMDISAQTWGGWSKSSRGFCGASMGPTFSTGRINSSATGSWNRRLQQYTTALGESKTSYLNAWGWSARSRWKIGAWSMGPNWSGEYWKADLSGTDSIPRRNPLARRMRAVTVSASGVQVSQSIGWSFTRTYLSAFHLRLDLAKSFGKNDVSTAAKLKRVQKLVVNNTQDALIPDNSFSVALGLGLEW